MRIGNGYDVHKLVSGRPLILGGENIPFEFGLEGHSDADVLVHAIMDSLLGALALGDIGRHFPDTDLEYKNADSLKLLEKVGTLIYENNYIISNIDSIIVAQKPKMINYIPKMRQNIASALKTEQDIISVKATTTEHLGFAGRGEGIASYAVCLLKKIK